MAFAFINEAHAASESATSLTCNKPTDTAQNDIMFAWVGRRSVYTLTPPSGWTEIASEEVYSGQVQKIFWKLAGASEPSDYTWEQTDASRFTIVIATFRDGFDTTDPIDAVSNTEYITSDTTVRTASFTASAANSPIINFACFSSSTAYTFTKPTAPVDGWTEHVDYNASRSGVEICSMVWTGSGATGDIDATISGTVADGKHGFGVILNVAAGGPTGPVEGTPGSNSYRRRVQHIRRH